MQEEIPHRRGEDRGEGAACCLRRHRSIPTALDSNAGSKERTKPVAKSPGHSKEIGTEMSQLKSPVRARDARRRATQTAVVACLAVLSLVGSALPASAAEDPTDVVAGVVESAVASLDPVEVAHDAAGVDVIVPTGSDEDIIVRTGDSDGFAVGLPTEAQTADGEVTRNGSTVYLGVEDSVDVSVETLASGVRISTVIDESDTDSVFTYPLEDGVTPEINADQTISLFKEVEAVDPETGETVAAQIEIALVQPAWAVDASGLKIPTHYEVTDDAIVQVVDRSTDGIAYPVVADPTFEQINPFQRRIRWNRAETATIAAGGWGATGLTAVCGLAGAAAGGPVGAAAFAALCLAASGSAVYTAGVAQNSNPKKCLQLTVTFTIITSPIPWFDTYSGGYCR